MPLLSLNYIAYFYNYCSHIAYLHIKWTAHIILHTSTLNEQPQSLKYVIAEACSIDTMKIIVKIYLKM